MKSGISDTSWIKVGPDYSVKLFPIHMPQKWKKDSEENVMVDVLGKILIYFPADDFTFTDNAALR